MLKYDPRNNKSIPRMQFKKSNMVNQYDSLIYSETLSKI